MKNLRLMSLAALAASSPYALAEDFDCLIEPLERVEIRSPVSGLIEKILVKRGDLVSEGMPIVRLESSVERSAVELAKFKSQMTGPIRSGESRVEFAKHKFERKKALTGQKYMSVQETDEAEGELRLAEAELVQQRENKQLAALELQHSVDQLNLRSLRSPFTGVVVDQLLHKGEMVDSGDGRKPILKLARIDPLRVDVILPVTMYGRIKNGTRVAVIPEAPIGGEYASAVSVVDKVVDAASGTFGARIELKNPDGKLPGGIKCHVRFSDVAAGPDATPDVPAKQASTATRP